MDSDLLVQPTFFATDCFDKLSTSSQIGTDFLIDQGRKKSTITAVASRLPVLCPPEASCASRGGQVWPPLWTM
jgi:hypothetical protein